MAYSARQIQNYANIVGSKPRQGGPEHRSTYSKVMAESILEWTPQINGFRQALNFFLDKRKQVILTDIKSAFLAPGKIRLESLNWLHDQSKILDEIGPQRLTGKAKKNIYTPVTEHSQIRGLYHLLSKKKIHKRWMPKNDKSIQLSHPALIITKVKGGKFHIFHTRTKDIPVVLARLSSLWNQTLKAQDPQEIRSCIAQFEWWFFIANPVGRSGAALGDCLSRLDLVLYVWIGRHWLGTRKITCAGA
jgi:hypothetical protein